MLFGGVHLLMIIDARVVTCLSVAILTASHFTRISIEVRCAVENGWRVRIWTSRLWINEAVGLLGRFLEAAIHPRLMVGKDYRVDRDVLLRIRQPEEPFQTIVRARCTGRRRTLFCKISLEGRRLGWDTSVVLKIAERNWIWIQDVRRQIL